MLAYVKLVQSREKELGCDVLTHQKWSGAGYIDGILGAIQSGSSGSKSMGEGNTETGMSSIQNYCLPLTASRLLDKDRSTYAKSSSSTFN
jgi:hypothetical protein